MTAPRLPVPSEHAEQVALFDWIEVAQWGASDEHRAALALAHGIPNGGKRNPATAGRLKAEGVRAGVPDVCLPCRSADGAYIGLYIELKRQRGGTVSPVQECWHAALRAAGHRVVVARGWMAAAEAVADHLGLDARSTPWRSGR